ncbi:MAG: hypothetical protein ACK40G_11900 [Cytophagaceae bacterium]
MGRFSTFILFIAFFAGFSLASYSQDLIIKKGGDEITGKVIEMNGDTILYKKNPADSVVLTLPKSAVFMIKFENGIKIVMDSQAPAPSQQRSNSVVVKPQPQPTQEEDKPQPKYIEPASRGYYYYNGRRMTRPRINGVLRTANDEEINQHVRDARLAHNIGTVSALSSIPVGLAGFISFVTYMEHSTGYWMQDPTINYYNRQNQYLTYTVVGAGSVVVLHLTQIVLKKIVREREYKKAVERYNMLQDNINK